MSKAATLPESVAAEVLDFLEFLTAKKQMETQPVSLKISRLRRASKIV